MTISDLQKLSGLTHEEVVRFVESLTPGEEVETKGRSRRVLPAGLKAFENRYELSLEVEAGSGYGLTHENAVSEQPDVLLLEIWKTTKNPSMVLAVPAHLNCLKAKARPPQGVDVRLRVRPSRHWKRGMLVEAAQTPQRGLWTARGKAPEAATERRFYAKGNRKLRERLERQQKEHGQ